MRQVLFCLRVMLSFRLTGFCFGECARLARAPWANCLVLTRRYPHYRHAWLARLYLAHAGRATSTQLSVCAGSALLYQATTLLLTLSLRLLLGYGAESQEFPKKADISTISQGPRTSSAGVCWPTSIHHLLPIHRSNGVAILGGSTSVG